MQCNLSLLTHLIAWGSEYWFIFPVRAIIRRKWQGRPAALYAHCVGTKYKAGLAIPEPRKEKLGVNGNQQVCFDDHMHGLAVVSGKVLAYLPPFGTTLKGHSSSKAPHEVC